MKTKWGNYSTEIYITEAEERIKDSDKENPFILYLVYQAVHSANHPEERLQALDVIEWVNKFQHNHSERGIYAPVIAYMHYGIGRVNSTHGPFLTGRGQHRYSQDSCKHLRWRALQQY